MNSVLAFDLGSKCGWAYGRKDCPAVDCGLLRTAPTRFESQGMRFSKFERLVKEILAHHQVDIIAFEEVRRHTSTISAQVYGGYVATLMKICDELGLEYFGLGVGQIKKHATGKGNASKELMIEAAKRRWPDQKIITDDVADALHILALGLSKL